VTPSDIFEPKPDRKNAGEPEGRPLGPEERKALADYYEAGLRIGITSDDLLIELEKRFGKSARQNQRYIKEQRELRETSRRRRLLQHFEDLALTASILARNANCLLNWEGSYEENWGDVVIGVQPREPYRPGVLIFRPRPEDPYAGVRDPPTMANEYSATCLLAHFNDGYAHLEVEDWKSITIQTVNKDVVDALQSLAKPMSLKAVQECPECKSIAE
jgi:hypothetical protein